MNATELKNEADYVKQFTFSIHFYGRAGQRVVHMTSHIVPIFTQSLVVKHAFIPFSRVEFGIKLTNEDEILTK